MRSFAVTCLIWMTLIASASGQSISVQQPILGVTSGSSGVVVSNGGRTFLGGVSSAQSGRSRFGFGQRGSSLGLSRSSTSMSAGATIIDLREMDEAILNSIPDQRDSTSPFARHATAIRSTSSERPSKSNRDTEPASERAAKFERLALKAQDENRLRVARLHWQMAAKYGSEIAREKLITHAR